MKRAFFLQEGEKKCTWKETLLTGLLRVEENGDTVLDLSPVQGEF